MSSSHDPDPVDASAGYDRSEPHLKPVIHFVVWLTVLCVITFISMKWLFREFERMEVARASVKRHALADPSEIPPAPRLQPNPTAEMREYRAGTAAHAGSYGWIDRDAGVVRIPLERALEIVAQRGLPHREEAR